MDVGCVNDHTRTGCLVTAEVHRRQPVGQGVALSMLHCTREAVKSVKIKMCDETNGQRLEMGLSTYMCIKISSVRLALHSSGEECRPTDEPTLLGASTTNTPAHWDGGALERMGTAGGMLRGSLRLVLQYMHCMQPPKVTPQICYRLPSRHRGKSRSAPGSASERA
jgi:hypothetical protein